MSVFKLFITLFILSNLTHAIGCDRPNHGQGSVYCTPHLEAYENSSVDDILNATEHLANCTDDKYLSEAKAIYQQNFSAYPIKRKKINGIYLKGSAKELNIYKRMISGNGDLPSTYAGVANNCETVLCAVETILGSKESAYRALNISHRSNYTVAVKQVTPEEHIWNKDELRKLNYAIDSLPVHLLDSDSNDRMYSYPEGYRQIGMKNTVQAWAQYGSKKRGEIVFTEHIRNSSFSGSVGIMVHELTHHHSYKGYKGKSLSGKNTLAYTSGYAKVNGWKHLGRQYEIVNGVKTYDDKWEYDSKNSCFPNHYASTSLAEDFAEAASFYVTKPKYLKNKCPKIYAFMKDKTFKGKEFINDEIDNRIKKAMSDPAVAKQMKACIRPKQNVITMDEGKYIFATFDGKMTSYSSSTKNNLKSFTNKECISEVVTDLLGDYPFSDQACSKRENISVISSKMRARISKHYAPALQKEVKAVLAKSDALQKQCYQEKDLTDKCLKDKLNQLMQKLSFDVQQLKVINTKESKPYQFSPKELPTEQVLVNCLASFNSFEDILVNKNEVFCPSTIKAMVQNLGYKTGPWFNSKYKNINKEVLNSSFAQNLKNDFIGKTKKEMGKNCTIRSKSCIKKKIKEKLTSPPYNLNKDMENFSTFVERLYIQID